MLSNHSISHTITMTSRFTETKGKPAISMDGFVYRLKKAGKTTKNWQCVNKSCTAKITTPLDTTEIILGSTSHNHDADINKIQVMELRLACKRKAEDDLMERTRNIIIQEVEKIGDDRVSDVTQNNIDQVSRGDVLLFLLF